MASITEGTPNTTASATFDVAIPAHAAGDVLVLVAAKNQGTSAVPAISTAGWTTSLQVPNTTATNHILLGYKSGDGSESTVRVTNMAGGAAVIGKVYRIQGATTTVVGTPDSESASDVTTTALDVGTAASGDIGFVALAFANTTSSPSLSNSYTLDESNAYYLLGYKVLDSTDESVTASWTTSRSYRAGLLVLQSASYAGTIAVTTADATMSAAGAHSTVGTVAATLDDATSSASGVHSTVGTVAVTLTDAAMAADGEHATGATGTVAVTLDGAAIEASGIHTVVGSFAVTLDDAAGAAAGAHSTVGSIAVTLDDAVLSATGGITYIGTITATLDDATIDAAGGPELAGQITTTLDDATMAAYGDVVDLQAIIHMYRRADRDFALGVKRRLIPRTRNAQVAGSIAVTLADAAMECAAVHNVAGTVAVALDDAVSSCDGTVGVIGAGVFALGDATSAADGTVHPAGTISITLDDATMSAAGEPEVAGTIVVTLDDAASAAAGFGAVSGTVAAIVADAVSAGVGAHGVSGTVAASLASATVVATGQVGAGSDGLDIDGSVSEYAWTAHASALVPTTELDIVVFAAADDWTPAANQALLAKWSAAGNQRNWGLHVNSGGNLVMNLSANGSTTAVLVGTPGSPLVVGGAGYWIRSTWRSSDGQTAIFVVEASSVSENVPTSWGTAIATGTKFEGVPMNATATTAALTVGAINDGSTMNYSGMIRYAEVRHAIDGPAVWAFNPRAYPDGTTSFTDSVGGRAVTVTALGGSVPVGMPLGTEAANVGPTAAVLGHTPVPYSALASQTPSKVISTSVANAAATTVVTSDGVTRRVFEKLNVEVCVQVTSSTPVLIRDSKMGRVEARNGADVWVEWSDIGYGYARSGDDPCAAATIWDGTDSTFATSASYNGMTTVGSGGDTITADAGTFTGECTSASGTSDPAKMTVYRCNLWGHTDASYTGGKVPGSLESLAEQTLVECWWHDYLWMPRDWSRRFQEDGGNSHCDGTKVNAGALLIWRRCRVDMWPVVAADFADLEGPYWRGPHWGKNPENANWPLQRSDTGTRKFLPVAFLINNQAGGISKNNLVEDCIISGPWGTFFQFGSKTVGTTYQQNITIRRNRFETGITAGGPTFTNPRSAFMTGPNNTPASYKWHWPTTGPDVNYGVDGNAITIPPKAGFLNDSSFTPT